MHQIRWAALGSSLVALLSTTGWAAQIECPKVISVISRNTSGGAGRGPDISEIAKDLGTSVAWIEHCMRTYGRRPRRPGLESAEGRESRLEAMESYEPEEPLEPEDRGERDRPPSREKQRKLSQKKPTPSGLGGD